MTDPTFQTRQARIDVPLKTTHAYLYVDPVHSGWDPLVGFALPLLG